MRKIVVLRLEMILGDITTILSLTIAWLVICISGQIFCKMGLGLVTRATDKLRCGRTDGACVEAPFPPWNFGQTIVLLQDFFVFWGTAAFEFLGAQKQKTVIETG